MAGTEKSKNLKPRWQDAAGCLLLALVAVAAYANTFGGPFILDDFATVSDNPTLFHLWPLGPVLHPPSLSGSGGRPFLNLIFALNHTVSGLSTPGYHAVNLAIHILAGWILFGLVRRTLILSPATRLFADSARPLALSVAVIWTVHPLLTESVTYISQRAESLAGLLYLLSLYSFVRASELEATPSSGKRSWLALSVLSCFAAVATKEIAVTLPIVALLYDRTFISGSFRDAWRRHGPFLLWLTSSWILLALLMLGLGERSVGFGQGISVVTYALTECKAVVHYLQLSLWPSPLVFDYGVRFASGVAEVWPYALILAVLLGASVFNFARNTLLGFACAWVFLLLAPTSSLVPIVGQPIAENRMYLPLAGIACAFVLCTYTWIGRRSYLLFALLAVVLTASTFIRNKDYATTLSIWTDTVAKCPDNYRAQNDLANALLANGQVSQAAEHFEEALRRAPPNALPYFLAVIHFNLGKSLRQLGRKDDAFAQYQEAVRLKPTFSEAHNSLGVSYYEKGLLSQALQQFAEAVRLNPQNTEARNNFQSLQAAAASH